MWHDIDTSPTMTVSIAYQNLFEWQQACLAAPTINQHQEQYVVWTPPPPRHVKCNIDVALFKEHNQFGMNLCLRNKWGKFEVAKTAIRYNSLNPVEAETWSLLHALSWLKDYNFQ